MLFFKAQFKRNLYDDATSINFEFFPKFIDLKN